MSQSGSSMTPQDEMIGLRMVKDRLLTEAQLSTAMDFQKAVGGALSGVLARLNLIEQPRLDEYLSSIGFPPPGAEEAQSEPGPTKPAPARAQERTVALTHPEPPSPSRPPESAESKRVPGVAESSIVVDALVRLLVRKGVIGKDEIKEEVLRLDPSELVLGESVPTARG